MPKIILFVLLTICMFCFPLFLSLFSRLRIAVFYIAYIPYLCFYYYSVYKFLIHVKPHLPKSSLFHIFVFKHIRKTCLASSF
jgi:hypothetical protein